MQQSPEHSLIAASDAVTITTTTESNRMADGDDVEHTRRGRETTHAIEIKDPHISTINQQENASSKAHADAQRADELHMHSNDSASCTESANSDTLYAAAGSPHAGTAQGLLHSSAQRKRASSTHSTERNEEKILSTGYTDIGDASRDENVHVIIAGYLGATTLWMSEADLCFVGGSLLPDIGGHNVMEPALLKCAVIHGRHMDNAQHLVSGMLQQDPDSLLCVGDARELGDAVLRMFLDDGERDARRAAAYKAAVKLGDCVRGGLVERVCGALPES
jgi:hypothetical protein